MQADKQASRQAGRQTDRQTGNETGNQTYMYTSRHKGEKTDRKKKIKGHKSAKMKKGRVGSKRGVQAPSCLCV
jgi:hypothetical protein